MRWALLAGACAPTAAPVVPASVAAGPAVVVRTDDEEVGVPRTATTPWPVVAGSPWPTIGACATADCWVTRADEAERLGDVDVAASHRGQAFAAEPAVARLDVWIDAMVAIGAVQRARDELVRARARIGGDASLVAAIDRRMAALPATPRASAATGTLSAALRAAYTAEVLGRWDEAAAGFAAAASDDPVHLARAGSAEARRGAWVAARRNWAAARTRFSERGARLAIEPIEAQHVKTAGWRGEELATMWFWDVNTADDDTRRIGVLELRAPVRGAPARRLYLPVDSAAVAFTADGQSFLYDDDGAIVLRDLLSGTTCRVIARVDHEVRALRVAGTGDELLVLAIVGPTAGLWDARGQQVATFPLTGTTPTVMRVYTGEGMHHDNIERDSPTWPVLLAMTAKAALVAVGGSDGTVHVFDRAGTTTAVLPARAGAPVEPPVALGFDAKEQLVALYDHEIVVWDPRSEQVVARHTSDCSDAEVAAGRSDAEACATTQVGSIAGDGSVATIMGYKGYRVRSAETGRTRVFGGDEDLPNEHVMLSSSGVVGLVDFDGAAAVVRPDPGVIERVAEDGVSGPLTPKISSDGRVLQFSAAGGEHVWDLVARRRLPVTRGPKEAILAISSDGRWAAIDAGEVLEVRATDSGRAVFSQASAMWAYAFVANSGHAVFYDVGKLAEDGPAEVVVARPDGAGTTHTFTEMPLALSEDGAWLVTGGAQGMRLRRTAAAERVVRTLHRGFGEARFSGDGAQLLWVVEEETRTRVGALRLARPGGSRALTLRESVQDLTFSADGREVLILCEDGLFVRWWPATGKQREVGQVSLIGANEVVAAANGTTIYMPGFDHVQVRTNDRGVPRVGAIRVLPSGGWLAISASGAIDGSDDAPAMTITWVEEKDGRRVFDGRLGWDGAYVPGAVTRMLAGDDVAAPVLARTPRPEQPLDDE